MGDTKVSKQEANGVNISNGNHEEDAIPRLTLSSWATGENAEKVKVTIAQFKEKFGVKPTFYVRVPGRVNLIGEHIDYCGYGVFPMAIQQDVFICARKIPSSTENKLSLTNTNANFDDFECRLDQIWTILSNRKTGVAPEWYFYFLCGVQGILEHLNIPGTSFQVCVNGKVPLRAGLSSSSALVCAAALTTLVAFDGNLTKKGMATLCAKSERYIGTEGGGMDQAIAFLATEGSAQLIEFVPKLQGENVKLPRNAVFVIANSLADANKAAFDGYNIRVVECRIGCWILAKRRGIPDIFQFNRFKDLQLKLGINLEELLDFIQKELHDGAYDAEEISQILQLNLDSLLEQPILKKIPFSTLKLNVKQRSLHVVQEAARVYEFQRVCQEERESSEVLSKLGNLMNGSHKSLKELYECSHPYLDKLIDISMGKSYGARLTGAGWGGCMVALLDQNQLSNYLLALKKDFYEPVHQISDLESHVFVTQPGSGALIFDGEKGEEA